jgi:PAS domain S-box-containing protein
VNGSPCEQENVIKHLSHALPEVIDLFGKGRDGALRFLWDEGARQVEGAILITTARLDPPGPQISYASPAFLRMSGYEIEELLGKPPLVLHGPKTDRRLLDQLQERLALGESCSAEFIFYRKDGAEYAVEASVSPIRDHQGEITHFISAQRDATDRNSARRFREQLDFLDDSKDAIAVADLNGGVTYWGKGAARLYGWSSEEMKGKRLADLLFGATPPGAAAGGGAEEFERALFEQGKWRGELAQLTKDGSEIIVESRFALLHDERGEPESVIIVNTDVTETRRLEAVVLRAQRLESIGSLASAIAHDLNNVLAPILMALHTLQQRFTDENSRRWISLMSKSAERGKDLIERVLTFARGAEGERAPLQTVGLIRDIAKILKDTLPKNIELQVQAPEDLWSVIGDTTQIHQVLMNLCINARDAMPAGGKLMIKARNRRLVEEERRLGPNPLHEHYVRISVSDTGIGIPQEIQDRIFDPFFTTKERGKGSGLGLSTALVIVRGHGGFVNLFSKVGKGTEFKVYLPAQPDGALESGEGAGVDPASGRGELILLVDDESDIREVASATLEKYGYRVLSARDGREAVALYRQWGGEIQLVITDMVMPELDGQGAIQAINAINADARIIATSGEGSMRKIIDARRLGVRAFLPKPYTAERLLDLVARTLDGRPAEGESAPGPSRL